MNTVNLIGRICKDVDVRYSQTANGNMCIARYTLAVDRKFKKEGQATADFINCVAMGKNGEIAEKYFKKGIKIAVIGHIQTGSYTNKDGNKVFTFDVMVDSQEFCESKNASTVVTNNVAATTPNISTAAMDDFMNISDTDFDSLPFN